MKEYPNYNLLKNNTFGLSSHCRRFLDLETAEEVAQLPQYIGQEDFPLLIIGGGSNLLLTKDYPATVVHTAIKGWEIIGETSADILVRCGAGETWDDFVEWTIGQGGYGLENLSAIPGEVGASAVQNIGAYGVEAKDFIHAVEAVEIITGEYFKFTNFQCEYAYRDSKFKNEWRDRFIITHVTYRLSKTFRPCVDYGNVKAALEQRHLKAPTAKDMRQLIMDVRAEKLPDYHEEGNAGSFFKNPVVSYGKFEKLREVYPRMPYFLQDDGEVKIPAGWLIETCGWKGKCVGNAGVHEKQALVLVNKGGASGEEVLELCRQICQTVRENFGIELQPEVNIR